MGSGKDGHLDGQDDSLRGGKKVGQDEKRKHLCTTLVLPRPVECPPSAAPDRRSLARALIEIEEPDVVAESRDCIWTATRSQLDKRDISTTASLSGFTLVMPWSIEILPQFGF